VPRSKKNWPILDVLDVEGFFWFFSQVYCLFYKFRSFVSLYFSLDKRKHLTVSRRKSSGLNLRVDKSLAWQVWPPVADDIDQVERWPRPGSLSRRCDPVLASRFSLVTFSLPLNFSFSPLLLLSWPHAAMRCVWLRWIRSWLWTSAPLLFQPRSCTCATTSRSWAKSPTIRIYCSWRVSSTVRSSRPSWRWVVSKLNSGPRDRLARLSK